MSGMRRKDIPCHRVPLVVGWTGRVDALVASFHIETHAIRPTAYVLLQTLINIWGQHKTQSIISGSQKKSSQQTLIFDWNIEA
jgi:hypothetical protein